MPAKRKAFNPGHANTNKRKSSKRPQPCAAAQVESTSSRLNIESKKQRWAEVSGSKNLYTNYREVMQKSGQFYDFICICNPLSSVYGHDEDKEADSNASDSDSKSVTQNCDGGETCQCGDSMVSNPSHPYIVTKAGLARYDMAYGMLNLRDPAKFDMYTFNDHMAYGALEVVQNMLLDFNEAYEQQQWCEIWAVIEAMALFLLSGQGDTMYSADDGETIEETAIQIALMLLATLALLGGEDRLAHNTDTKNLGWVLKLYLEVVKSMQKCCLLTGTIGVSQERSGFCGDDFSSYVQSYANHYGVTAPDVTDAHSNVKLAIPNEEVKDPWDWASSFANYKLASVPPEYAFRGAHRRAIGGDALDISTWTSAERKRYAYDKKDPLPKKTIQKLKEGFPIVLYYD